MRLLFYLTKRGSMKKSALLLLLFFAVGLLQAETIKMKSGDLISGSILSQTEYTLNLATSYGNITLSQKEIEQILPDKHRVFLKGGTQLVGIIVDLDEFNMKLQTDDGNIVNVDMPQIVSVEIYDYDQGKSAQKEFVEETQQKQETARQEAKEAAARNASPTVEAAGGLTFDSDIDQVFDAKKATVVNGGVLTPSARVIPSAPQKMTDEDTFIKGVKTGEISQKEYVKAAKENISSKPASPKATPKKRSNEKDFSKYFAVQVGAMPLDLQLDNSSRSGYSAEDSFDVGGTSAVVSSRFLWRVKESNLWLGPSLSIANISNNSFEEKDPNAVTANDEASSLGEPLPFPDMKVKTSGQILQLGIAGNYYLIASSRFGLYLTASAAYEMLTLNYRGEVESHSIKSNGFAGAAGLGAEVLVDDVLIGLEARQVFSSRSDELKDSAASNTVIQAQLSWKF